METRIDNEECRAYIEVSNPLGWDGDQIAFDRLIVF